MPLLSTRVLVPIVTVVGVGLAGLLGSTWRYHRQDHSAHAFLAVLLTMALLGLLSSMGMYYDLGSTEKTSLWDAVLWSGIYLLQIIWLAFAFKYTGLGDAIPRWRLIPHSIIALVPVIWIFTNRSVIAALFLLPWLLIMIGSMTGGMLLTIRSAFTFKQMPIGQAISLMVAPVAPFVFPAFRYLPSTMLVGLSTSQAVIVGLFVGTVGLSIATSKYRMFASIPGVGYFGRDQVIEQMKEGVIVIDQQSHVIDFNRVIERTFDIELGDAIGVPVADLIGVDPASVQVGEPIELHTTSGLRRYEITASTITDGGQAIGQTLVLRDITERETREQRLQVLNRVLRHNLRNDLNAVMEYADMLTEKPSMASEYGPRIRNVASNLVDIGEKARTIEDVVATQSGSDEAPLRDVIADAVQSVREDYPTCEIQVQLPEFDAGVNRSVLKSVLQELLENACKHNDANTPVITVSAAIDRSREYPILITVTDNGPGIPEHELIPIQQESESALEHASGLGLWFVKWGVSTLNGTIEFDENDPRGTVVTVYLQPRV